MGFLDNTTITVDAVLTKKGREVLARGVENFKITKFALAADEIDYNLWDTSHPNGSSYYGAVIENMPLLEAFVDENQIMRYKLITLPKNTVTMAVLNIDSTVKEIYANSPTSIQPSTLNLFTDESYTFTIHNTDIAVIQVVDSGTTTSDSEDRTMTISNAKEVSVVGQTLSESTSLRKTQLTITGQQSGQSVVITWNHQG